METHDVTVRDKTYFWHPVRLRWNTPVLHTAVTNEVDEPFRRSDSRVFHLWPTTLGAVFGKWQDTGRDEDKALWEAIQGVTRWDEPQRLEENAYGPNLNVEREIEPVVITLITSPKGKQKIRVDKAPKWSEATEELTEWMPKTRKGLLKVGKYRYRVHGAPRWDRRTRYIERIDRRSLGEFLFGGTPR